MHFTRLTLFLALGALIFDACSVPTDRHQPLEPSTSAVAAAPVARVVVAPGSAVIAINATLKLRATAYDQAGKVVEGLPRSWKSSDSLTVSVSTNGMVTGRGAGVATISVTVGGVTATATITVTSVQPPARWLMGYYAGYERALYPETTIDFSLLTHIATGAIEPTATGGVDQSFWVDPTNGPIMARTIATRAHQAGRKALLMLGGAGYRNLLIAATSTATRATFVANLVTAMTSLGYDGIDVDWEPVLPADLPALLDLIQRLRAARPSMLLTMPVGWVNANAPTVDPWYAQAAGLLDRMNIMTYGMADNWGGWVSWHEGALAGQGPNHPSSVSSSVAAFRSAGIPAAKLGLGIGFFGSCWQGVNAMLQPLSSTARVVAGDGVMSYTTIVNQYYAPAAHRWDATAKQGYLSFAAPTGPSQCTLVSYHDPMSVNERGSYLRANGLGGAIIWTIGQGHFLSAPAGQRDPLLSAAYNAIVP
jgi:chitinase